MEIEVGKMVEIVHCPLRGGGRIEIRAPIEEARWLRALFTRDANAFRTLRDMGFEVVGRADEGEVTSHGNVQ